MGQVRNVTRIAALEATGPADALARVDRYMLAADLAELTTIAHAQLDVDGRHLAYASAGHLAPVLIRPDGTADYLPCDPLPPLGTGLTEQVVDLIDHSVALAPGDTLILFTDGLVERRHESLQDRLDELLRVSTELAGRSPQELCEQLLELLVGGQAQADDIALLVVSLDANEVIDFTDAAIPAVTPAIEIAPDSPAVITA